MAANEYYVSVGSRTVQNTIPETEYMAVRADDAELQTLQELLARLETVDEASHMAATVPYKSNEHVEPAHTYDENLVNLYRFLHLIGTEETKRFIEDTGIIQKLQNTDYNYPGYKR